MHRILIFTGLAAALGACGQSSDNKTQNEASANAAAPKKERPPYCFFKESETKAWAASRDKDGNIVVKGKAYRSDSRYKALLGPPEINGATASIAPTITNNTSYAAPDNWWDVSATIPNSSAIESVTVTCGSKTLADLKVAPKA